MAIDLQRLRIVHYPDPILRAKAKPVPEVNDEIRALAMRMIELMGTADGVGLAAPQVGLGLRLFVVNPTGEPGNDHVYINPELIDPSRELEDRSEGCLSLPGVGGEIRRPRTITIRALNLEGQVIEERSSELLARIWQHEYDHLEGIMIIDRMPPMDRHASKKHLRELEEIYNESQTRRR